MKKLNKEEMKKVIGGRVVLDFHGCSADSCSYYESGTGEVMGTCQTSSADKCVCKGPNSSIVSDSQCSGY